MRLLYLLSPSYGQHHRVFYFPPLPQNNLSPPLAVLCLILLIPLLDLNVLTF